MIRRFPTKARRSVSDFYYFFDDFFGSNWDDRVWMSRGSGGSLSLRAGGVIRVRATANNNYELYQNDLGDSDVAHYARCQWRFKKSATAMQGEIGFMGESPYSTTDWICIMYDSALGSNWRCQTAADSVVTTTDTGIASDNNYHDAIIECAPGAVRFYLDGVYMATHTTNISSRRLQLYCYVVSKTGAARDVLIDFVELSGDRDS